MEKHPPKDYNNQIDVEKEFKENPIKLMRILKNLYLSDHLDTETIKRAVSHRENLELVQDEPYSTLYIKQFNTYFLDGCTILTKKINVLIIEDNML